MAFRRAAKRLLVPAREAARRFLNLPTLEEQSYVSYHGALHSAATFSARNFVAGDYAEFGVWEGDSFICAYRTVERARTNHLKWMRDQPTQQSVTGVSSSEFSVWKNWEPRFLAFDSFAGLPDPGSEELHEHWTKGSFSCSEDRFRLNLSRSGIPPARIATIPGFYENTLCEETKRNHNLQQIAIAMIDCDLYESTRIVLDFLTDLLVQGSILVFDDWFYYRASPKRGQQRACREWLEANPHIDLIEFWREPPQPISFIVNFEAVNSSRPYKAGCIT